MSNPPITAAPIVNNTEPAHALGPEPLTGKHITLEHLAEKHIPDLWENIGTHTDLWTWWPEGPFTESEFSTNMKEFSTFMAESLAVYAVLLNSGPHKNKAIGLVMGLSESRDSNRIAELGAFFGPLLRKSRAATEALFIVGDRLFELNHRRLGWKTNSLNRASRNCAERFGFLYEGTFRQDQINKGRNRDSVSYSIVDSEWPMCKKALELWLDDENFDGQDKQRRTLMETRESLK